MAAAVAEAAAAAEASKQPGAAPANPTDALTRALHAARVATLVAETARSLPATSADMPVSDQKLAMSLVSQLKAAQNANNTALKESTKLANEQVARLSKQGLGAAATLHSVLCVLYSDLACKVCATPLHTCTHNSLPHMHTYPVQIRQRSLSGALAHGHASSNIYGMRMCLMCPPFRLKAPVSLVTSMH